MNGVHAPPVVITIKDEPPSSSYSDPPLLVPTSMKPLPPLIRTRVGANANAGPPRLIPTTSKRAQECTAPKAGSISSSTQTSPPPQSQASPAAVQSSLSDLSVPVSSRTPTPNNIFTCCIGPVYRVACHRKYLGAENGFKEWSELDESIQSAVLSKIQNQIKPEAGDLICYHHLKELSCIEESDPDSADKERGLCPGYGIVHKLPVPTTRLGVLTYFNNIAGKNRDVLPGKFVCSLCIKILRGSLNAFLPKTTPAELARKRSSTSKPTTTSDEPPQPSRKLRRVTPKRIEQNQEPSMDNDGDDEEETEFSSLQPSQITITEFGADAEYDPLDLTEIKLEEGEIEVKPQIPSTDVSNCAPLFQKLNRILATAGVPPLLVQNSDPDAPVKEILLSRATAKIKQLVHNCVKLLQKDGFDIDVQSVYNSF